MNLIRKAGHELGGRDGKERAPLCMWLGPLTQLLIFWVLPFSKSNCLMELVTESWLCERLSPSSLFVHLSSLGPECLQEARDGAADQSGRVGQACRRRLQAEESASGVCSHRWILGHFCTQTGNHRSDSPADHQRRNRWALCCEFDCAQGPHLQKCQSCAK